MARGLAGRLAKSRFVRDSATLQVASMINSAGALLGALALAHVLGSMQQGEFYLAIATYSLLWFSVNLGLYPVATSQVAAAVARKNNYKVAFWLAYLVKALAWMGVAFALLAFIALPHAAQALYGSERVGFVAAVIALTPLAELPKSVCSAALQGTRRMLALAKIENGHECVRIFLVVVGAVISQTALGAALGMLVASLIGSVLALAIYRREVHSAGPALPTIRDVWAVVADAPLLYGLRLGLRLGATQNMHALGVNILPTMVLGVVGNTRWVAYMRLAQRFVDAMRTLMQGINRTALPYFAELIGLDDIRGLRRAYWRATLGSGLIVSTGVLLSIPLVPYFVEFFPSDYRDPVWTLFLVLAPGVMVVSFSVANDTFYLVTDNLKAAIVIGAAQFCAHLCALGVLAYYFPRLGPSIALTLFFFSSVVHPVYAYSWFRKNQHRMQPVTAGKSGGV